LLVSSDTVPVIDACVVCASKGLLMQKQNNRTVNSRFLTIISV
jgi:hypothetical protein